MGMQLPDWVRNTFLVVTGDGWPEADEDALRALARAWAEVGDAIYVVEQRITVPVRGVRRTNWDGPAAEAFSAAGNAFAGQHGRQLAALAEGSRDLSTFISGTAVNVQYMKRIVIGELLILALQIAYLIATSPWMFGSATAAVPALQAAGRSFARTAVRQLAIAIAAGQTLQVGLDAVVQLSQLATGSRKRWDTNLTGFAAITGAVGGVVGPGLGALSHTAAGAIRPVLGTTLTKGLDSVVGNAVQEYATSVGTGLVTRQGWVGTPWDLTAGATEGAIDAVGGRRRGPRGLGGPPPTAPAPVAEMGRVDNLAVAPDSSSNETLAGATAVSRAPVATSAAVGPAATSGDVSTADPARRAGPSADGGPAAAREPVQPVADGVAEGVRLEAAPVPPMSVGGIDTTRPVWVLARPEQPLVAIGDTPRGARDGDSRSVAAEATGLDPAQQPGVAAAEWTAMRHRLDLPDAQVRQIVKLIRRVGAVTETRVLETAGVYAELYGQPGSRPRLAGTLYPVRGTDTIIHPRRLTDLHQVMELARSRFPELAGRPGPLSADDLLPVLRRSMDPTAQAVTPQRIEKLAAGIRQLRRGWGSGLAGLGHRATTRTPWHGGSPSVQQLQRHFLGTAEQAWVRALSDGPVTPARSTSVRTTPGVLAESTPTESVTDPAPEAAPVDAVPRRPHDDIGLGDADVRRIVRWTRSASSLDAFGLALETAHLYREFYGNPDGRLQLSRATDGRDATVTTADPRKMADLRRLLDLARRAFPPPAEGQVAAWSSDRLLPLVRRVLEPDADTVTRERLDRLIRGLHEVRRDWRFAARRARHPPRHDARFGAAHVARRGGVRRRRALPERRAHRPTPRRAARCPRWRRGAPISPIRGDVASRESRITRHSPAIFSVSRASTRWPLRRLRTSHIGYAPGARPGIRR